MPLTVDYVRAAEALAAEPAPRDLLDWGLELLLQSVGIPRRFFEETS